MTLGELGNMSFCPLFHNGSYFVLNCHAYSQLISWLTNKALSRKAYD